MGLTVFMRHIYDDVALLASTDAEANSWRLEAESRHGPGWVPVASVIECANLNWSTPDLTMWDELREGDPNTIRRAFPDASRGIPVGEPLAVMWDVSSYYYNWQSPQAGKGYLLRFTDPLGETFEFGHSVISGNDQYTFGRG